MKRFWLVSIGIVLFISLNWQPSQLLAEDDCPVTSVHVNSDNAMGVVSGEVIEQGCDALLEIENSRAYWVNVTLTPVGNGVTISGNDKQDQYLYSYRLIPPKGKIYYRVRFTKPEQSLTVFVNVTATTSDAARQANLSEALLDLLSLVGAVRIDTSLEIKLITEYYPALRTALTNSPHFLAASSAMVAGDFIQFLKEMDAARDDGELTVFAYTLIDIGFNVAEEKLTDVSDNLLGAGYINAVRIIWKNYSNAFKLFAGNPAGFVVFTAKGESGNLTFVPTVTAALTTSEIPHIYRVAFVANNDTLNIRSGAGANYKVVGTLAYNATGIEITGTEQKVGTSLWVPIQYEGLTGWVNRYYLTQEVDGNTFCSQADSRNLVDQLTYAFRSRDGNLLQSITGPLRGLLIRHNWWNKEVRILPNDVERFFDDKTIRDWGSEDGSGLAISGSLTQIILPLIDKDFFSNPQFKCNQIIGGGTAGLLQLPPEYEAVNFYSIYSPPPDNEDHYADWGTWVVGIEYWDGKPVICYLIHYEWEI